MAVPQACNDCGTLLQPAFAAPVRNGIFRCRPCQQARVDRAPSRLRHDRPDRLIRWRENDQPTWPLGKSPATAFGEAAALVRVTGSRDANGEWSETETSTAITCATAPASPAHARVREIIEGGVQLDAIRMFWLAEDVTVQDDSAAQSAGDIIVYAGERYRARATQRWRRYSEAIGVRIEAQ